MSKPVEKSFHAAKNKTLCIYYYGNGKGKTTAAIGTVMRAAGYNKPCLILQAIKNATNVGEIKFIKKSHNRNITIKTSGAGFIGIMGDRQSNKKHQKSAQLAINYAKKAINNGQLFLIILDEFGDLPEINRKFLSDLVDIISLSQKKGVHIIITGHRRCQAIIRRCQIVSRINKIKHCYDDGIMAVMGIDY